MHRHSLRPACLLLLCTCGLAAVEVDVQRNDPAEFRRFELPLAHAYYGKVAEDQLEWLAGTLVVSIAGPETAPQVWLTARRPEGPRETARMRIDGRVLNWDAAARKLHGSIQYRGYRDEAVHTLQLEAVESQGRVRGAYRIDHKRHRFSGLKDQSEGEGSIDGRVWTRQELLETQGFGEANWPGWRGGEQAGVANDNSDVALVEDLREARFLWKSDARTPMPGHTDSQLLGGYGEISLADNKVFLNYYVGHGDVYPEGKTFAESVSEIEQEMARRPGKGLAVYIKEYFAGDVEAYVRQKLPVLATDVIDCYDATTGLTLWQARFPGRGLNWYNCDGPHFNVTWDQGRAYAVGSAGALYCLDAETGEPIWEGWLPGIAPLPERLEQAVAAAQGGGKPNKHGPSDHFVNKPYAMDGVLVVAERGLYGLDGATGEMLWGPIDEVHSGNPRPWRHNGTTYALCRLQYGRGGVGGGIACVEVRTGKLMWVDRRFAGEHGREFANDGEFLFAGGTGKGGSQETIRAPTCYRLSPQGMKKLWSMEPITSEPRMGAPVLYDGHVYTYWHGGDDLYVVCIEAATGKEVGRYPMPRTRKFWQSLSAGNGRLFHCMGQQTRAPMLFATGEDFRILHDGHEKGRFWTIPGTFQVLSPIMVDGRILVREKGDSGVGGSRIYCYDLRQR